MINLSWAPFPGADVAGYKLYRSIIGFIAPIVDLNGLTLQLKINGGTTQSFMFDATSVIDQLNATISGARAYPSDDLANFMLRSNDREAGSVQVIGGTALSALGLAARTITAKSECTLIASITALVDPLVLVTFTDPDGTLQDWYAITTIDTLSNESLKSPYIQPITATGPLCVIEGVIMNIQGARVPDAEVTAVIQLHPEKTDSLANITLDGIKTISAVDGRFSLALLQGAIVKLECPRIGLSRMIRVPAQAYVFINDISVDLSYRYPIGSGG